MKRMLILLTILLSANFSFSQYLGVKARYTETRLVDDSPNPPRRENRLILSFFNVVSVNYQYVWTPTVLSNYDLWVYKVGLQYGSDMGGVLDSTGNNYPGYAWTAPKAVGYNNSLGLNYIDCNPNVATHYVVNGHELDCGFVTVSYWDVDWGTMQPFEAFSAPNICLPYQTFPDPNFSWPVAPGPPYNMYSFFCGGGVTGFVIRGVLTQDTGNTVTTLPVRFANVRGELRDSNASIEWSNMTESDVSSYTVERSATGIAWLAADTVFPNRNDGGRADYQFQTLQTEETYYYRIKATENNGSLFYSTIFVLRKQTGPSIPQETSRVLTIYPNPVLGNDFTFRLTNAEKGRYISAIVTPDGKQVKQKMITHDGGDLVRQVETSGLLPGIYRLVIRSTNYKYTQTFIYGY